MDLSSALNIGVHKHDPFARVWSLPILQGRDGHIRHVSTPTGVLVVVSRRAAVAVVFVQCLTCVLF